MCSPDPRELSQGRAEVNPAWGVEELVEGGNHGGPATPALRGMS